MRYRLPEPESKVVLDFWNEIGRKLTALAEDFPEDIAGARFRPRTNVLP